MKTSLCYILTHAILILTPLGFIAAVPKADDESTSDVAALQQDLEDKNETICALQGELDAALLEIETVRAELDQARAEYAQAVSSVTADDDSVALKQTIQELVSNPM